MFLISFGIALIAIGICWQYYGLKEFLRTYLHLRKLPNTTWLPILGNALVLAGKPASYFCKKINQYSEKHGKYWLFWVVQNPLLFCFDVNIIEYILSSNTLIEKSKDYDMVKNWLRDGLLLTKGKKWVQRRKMLTPAFHFQILQGYVEIFQKESMIFVGKIGEAATTTNNQVNLEFFINLVTLDIICETAMGVSINAQTINDSDYVKAIKTIATIIHKRVFEAFCRFDLTYCFTKFPRDEKKALKVLHGFTEKIILQRRDELLKEQQDKDARKLAGAKEDELIGVKRKMAFLDILLQSKIDDKPLSDLDIQEEVDTFMFEGHDTTSSAVNFFFYNMALNPECQQKCYDEIIQVFGKDKSTPVTYDGLNNLHYVELCIKETLRMFPSVPIIGRITTKDIQINEVLIPKGVNVGISPWKLGRDGDLFPDPDDFKPERFDVVTSAEKMSPFAYIPFSAGPRNCIGQKFAMLEIKTLVANTLRHFELDYVGDKSVEPDLVIALILRTAEPLLFKLTPRV